MYSKLAFTTASVLLGLLIFEKQGIQSKHFLPLKGKVGTRGYSKVQENQGYIEFSVQDKNLGYSTTVQINHFYIKTVLIHYPVAPKLHITRVYIASYSLVISLTVLSFSLLGDKVLRSYPPRFLLLFNSLHSLGNQQL